MSFLTEPKIRLVPGGEYELLDDVVYRSVALDRKFLFKKGFRFSPSIPLLFRPLVPENSDTVAASLPHDWFYKFQPIPRKQADNEWKAELEVREESWIVIQRSYWALRSGGWKAWNDNKKIIESQDPWEYWYG